MFSPDFYFVFKITILKMRNLCPTIFHNNSESRGWGKGGGGGEGGRGFVKSYGYGSSCFFLLDDGLCCVSSVSVLTFLDTIKSQTSRLLSLLSLGGFALFFWCVCSFDTSPCKRSCIFLF